MQHKEHKAPYLRFAIMMVISYALMFAFMYAMVDRWANVYANLNQAYMAGLMAAPMAVLELGLMGMMYPDKRRNLIIFAASLVIMILCWIGIRVQTAIDDRAFITSMIPHHAGAILMCGKADLKDAELKTLCSRIQVSQQSEIDQMKAIRQRLN